MIPEDNRFESDPEQALAGEPEELPYGWEVGAPDPGSESDVARLTELLRADEEHGRGWASSGEDEVRVELGGTEMRENLVVRDADGVIRAWGSVHDRAGGRMLLIHLIARDIGDREAVACSDVLVDWAVAQAQVVGAARGFDVQQIDCGAFAGDEHQRRLLRRAGFAKVRTWWQMKRPVRPEERDLVSNPDEWNADGVRFRRVRRGPDGMPEVADLQEVHEVLESAFVDHFNSHPETFWEFVHRLREDPGHTWDHWWLAESMGEPATPLGALVGSTVVGENGPDGSYVEYLGVLDTARGRGVAKGLLHTAIADAAIRGRVSIGLEVDADSPSGAHEMYQALGWETSYVTESWHRDIEIAWKGEVTLR